MKIIKLDKEAKKLIKIGVNKSADMVKISLGISGRNAIIGRPYQTAEITNDGKTIAEAIQLDDEIEQLGAEKIKEITTSTFDKVFDGTTTATTLAQSIFNAGYEKINQDNTFTKSTIDPIQVRQEIDNACFDVIKELDKMAKPIKDINDTFNVAMSSVKVKEYAQMIANIYNVIGKDGVITVEDSYMETKSDIVEGFEIESGYGDDDVFSNKDDKTFVLEKPLILVTNNTLNFKEQISPITAKLFQDKIRDLIVISDNFSKEIIDSFKIAKVSNTFNIIPIKTAYLGKKEKMQDIAIAIGATFYDKDLDLKCLDATKDNLGTAKKIVIEKDRTIIYGAKGNIKDRVKELQADLKKSKSKFDSDQLNKRIAKLNGGIGVIYVASTESDRTYLKKKINNAINTTKLALKEGVVKGGGLALKEISEKLPKNILTDSLLSPYNTIQSNAGGNLIIKDSVIDAVLTTKTALEIACNLAGLLLTCEVAIADKYEKPKDFKEEN